MKHEPEKDVVLRSLNWAEVALQRTIVGCVYLLVVALPEWIGRCLGRIADVGYAVTCRTGKAVTPLGTYGFRVTYMLVRVLLVALGWGLVLFSAVAIAVISNASWFVWPSIAWSLLLTFGSLSAYLRWRALEDRARDEWRDSVVNGRTVREWVEDVSAEGIMPIERKIAILTLVESGTRGQMALMAALTTDEGVPMNGVMKQWILAVVGELGKDAERFELTIRNLHRTSASEQIRCAARSALTRIGSRMD